MLQIYISSYNSRASLHTQILHLTTHVHHCIHRYYILYLTCIIAYTDITSYNSRASLHLQILHPSAPS